jgi:hypothetical protein
MLITLSVGEVKTVYARCGKQQRGATPKAAQTRIEQGTLAPCTFPYIRRFMTAVKTKHSHNVEPNWTLLGQEGGLPNPQYDKWVRVWCDLESRSTFAQSVAVDGVEQLFGDGSVVYEDGQEPDVSSWCGYEWDASGQLWELLNGPEGDHHWWEIDDLLWGALSECLFNVLKPDGLMMTKGEVWEKLMHSSYVDPEGVAQGICDTWQLV